MSQRQIYRRTRTISPEDIDGLGHVNNVVWVRFVVQLAEAHARADRTGSGIVRERGATWVVRRHEIDYRANAAAGDEIVEETWVESMRGARSVRGSRFRHAGDSRELVIASTEWAFVDA